MSTGRVVHFLTMHSLSLSLPLMTFISANLCKCAHYYDYCQTHTQMIVVRMLCLSVNRAAIIRTTHEDTDTALVWAQKKCWRLCSLDSLAQLQWNSKEQAHCSGLGCLWFAGLI